MVVVSCEYLLAVFEDLKCVFADRAKKLSSQSCPMDRSLPVRRFGRIWPVWAQADSAGDSGIVTRFVAVMVSPFATRTVGPFFTVVMLSQYFSEDG